MMNVKIWGCRGSLPSPGAEKIIYGGNTSCVELLDENTCLILDGGSGIQKLGESLPDSVKVINILLTHLHLDHIIGLGFFKPLFNPKMTVNIWGPSSSNESLEHRLRRYFSPPIFPIRLKELPSDVNIFEINQSEFSIGEYKITSEYVCHPGPTVGYRIEKDNIVLAYIPDHEPALGSSGFPNNQEWTSGYSLSKDAHILFHDAQFKNDKYENHIGWGHSSMEQALEFAVLCGVKKLVLFHHDFTHSDHQLEEMYKETMQNRIVDFEVELAKEGISYDLEENITDGV